MRTLFNNVKFNINRLEYSFFTSYFIINNLFIDSFEIINNFIAVNKKCRTSAIAPINFKKNRLKEKRELV